MATLNEPTPLKKHILELLRLTILVSIVFVILIISNLENQKTKRGDVLLGNEWTYLPGASVVPGGIRILPLDQKIIHQDGSWPQANPPAHVRGQTLSVSGDFELSIGMKNAREGASFRLYGELPIIFDEWRRERKSLNIEINKEAVILRAWDGNSSTSFDLRKFPVEVKEISLLTLRKTGEIIYIILDGQELGSMPHHNIFDAGKIWFGAEANINGKGWILTRLSAKALPGGKVEINPPLSLVIDQTEGETLKNLAQKNKRKLPIGTAISYYPLFFDEEYRETATQQFSIITPENSFKPQFLHPKPKIYAYEEGDSILEIALANGMVVHGHTLIWGKANPEWINESEEIERRQIMLDHIKNVVTHYKGKVVSWDVVNEIMSDKHSDYEKGGAGLRNNIWHEAMGEEYIELAFRAANEKDPGAALYINEFGLERDGERWDAFVRLLKRLKQKNVPVHGVGFEAHVYHDTDIIDPKILKKHMEELALMGLKSRISEIDVYGDNPNIQSRQYNEVLIACLEVPTCTAFSMWGITDKYGSTAAADRYPEVLGDSLLWYKDMKPKVGFFNLLETLR